MRLDAQSVACDGRGCAKTHRIYGVRHNEVYKVTSQTKPIRAADLPRGWETSGIYAYCASCVAAMRRSERTMAEAREARQRRLEYLRSRHA